MREKLEEFENWFNNLMSNGYNHEEMAYMAEVSLPQLFDMMRSLLDEKENQK